MPGIEEVKAGISLANGKAQEASAALAQGLSCLEEAQQSLATATQGTEQEEIQQASGLLAEVAQTISGAQSTIDAAVNTTESYAGRL